LKCVLVLVGTPTGHEFLGPVSGPKLFEARHVSPTPEQPRQPVRHDILRGNCLCLLESEVALENRR
jgi:hypothetical protein